MTPTATVMVKELGGCSWRTGSIIKNSQLLDPLRNSISRFPMGCDLPKLVVAVRQELGQPTLHQLPKTPGNVYVRHDKRY